MALAIRHIISQSCLVPLGSGMAWFSILTRLSALVKVPSFSKKQPAGSTTWASFAVSVIKISCTTRRSSFFMADFTWCIFACVAAGSYPMMYIAFNFPDKASLYIWGSLSPGFAGSRQPHASENFLFATGSSTF